MAMQFVPGYLEDNTAALNQPELAMPGLLEELKKKINRPVPELAHSTDTDLLEIETIAAAQHSSHVAAAKSPAMPVVTSLSESVAHFQQDAPSCPSCGHVAVRNGACYKCLNCGESLGCS